MSRLQLIIFLVLTVVGFPAYSQQEAIDIFPNYNVEMDFISTKDGLASKEVYCVAQDNFGFIWFGTKFGLNRYDGKQFKLFTTKNGLASNTVSYLFVNDKNELILQYGDQWSPHNSIGKSDVFDPATFKVKPFNKQLSSEARKRRKTALYHNIDKNSISRIEWISGENELSKRLKLDYDTRIYSMPGNRARIAYSEKAGLYYVEGDLFIKLLDKSELLKEDDGRINFFFKDALGNLWICTPSGVYRIKFKRNPFHSYFTNTQQTLYPWPQARGIYVNTENVTNKTIYANVMASVFSSATSLKQPALSPTWGVTAIGKRVYAFGFNLYEYDKKTLKLLRSENWIAPNKELSLCVYQFSDSILYIGTSTAIYAYNLFTHKKWNLQKSSKKIPVFKEVYRIMKTSKGIVAVAENGIYTIQNGIITGYYGYLSKEKSHYLSIPSMLDIHEDKNKCLWIATNGSGLVKWEWIKSGANQRIVTYAIKDGLPSMVLYRIEEDNSNHLWISTDDGIFSFSKINRQVKVYEVADGLPHHEFNRTSSFKANDGWIYFGGINGVTGFDPEDDAFQNKKSHAPFYVIGITKYSKQGARTLKWPLDSRNLQFQWLSSDRFIKIEFALLDFESWRKQFAYRILGVHDEWISIDENSISLGGLPYGNHTIEIKAKRKDGNWEQKILRIPIDVVAPFYLRTWFIVLSILILVFLMIMSFMYKGKRLQNRNIKLEKLIDERTQDLRSVLVDKDILMKELHHRVKNNLQIITGLLELQKEQLNDQKAIEALNEGQIRLSSIALIHQNFYGGTNLESISFNKFLEDLVFAVKQLFENEQRTITCSIHSEDITIDINTAVPLGLIINELLTNSYKYLPLELTNKRIDIDLIISDSETYQLVYKDNGLGLPPHVNFENSQTLGLRLIRGLANQINGSVSYKYDSGSVFNIQFAPQPKKN